MTCFAASLPFPVVPPLPGLSAAHSPVSAAVLSGVVAQSWGAHVRGHYGAPARCENTTKSSSVNLELVALLKAMALEVLTLPPVANLIPVHQPACAGGQWCVKADDLAKFADVDMYAPVYADALLCFAGLPVAMPWRKVVGRRLAALDGGVWLTLGELEAVLRYLPGAKAVKLRRALAGRG